LALNWQLLSEESNDRTIYTPRDGKIWEEENKYRIWLEIEILASEAQAELGVVPKKPQR